MTLPNAPRPDLRPGEDSALTLAHFSVDQVAVGMLWLNADGHIAHANHAAGRYLGRENDHLHKLSIFEIDLNMDQQDWSRYWTDLKTHHELTHESHFLGPDGSVFPVEITATYLAFDGLEYGCCCFRDISRRKRIESELRHSEQTARAFLNALDEPAILIDEQGKVLDLNDAAETNLDWPEGETIDRRLGDVQPPCLRRAIEEQLQTVFRSGKEVRFEIKIDERWLDCGIYPIADTDNGIRRLAVLIRNITQAKNVEHRLELINDELATKNEEMQHFVYTVSHDLKSPILTIQGFVDHLVTAAKAGKTDRLTLYSERIRTAADRMSAMIDDLLELSRIGRKAGNPEPTDPNDVIAEVITSYRDLIERSNITLIVREPLPVVLVDRVRLRRAIDNLINNAIKYGCDTPDPMIEVGGTERDDNVLLYVRDNGKGIPSAGCAKVFELFQRLDTQTTGTGVGLAIVRRIAEVHGGHAWVESYPGHETTFWLAFPKEADSKAS